MTERKKLRAASLVIQYAPAYSKVPVVTRVYESYRSKGGVELLTF